MFFISKEKQNYTDTYFKKTVFDSWKKHGFETKIWRFDEVSRLAAREWKN